MSALHRSVLRLGRNSNISRGTDSAVVLQTVPVSISVCLSYIIFILKLCLRLGVLQRGKLLQPVIGVLTGSCSLCNLLVVLQWPLQSVLLRRCAALQGSIVIGFVLGGSSHRLSINVCLRIYLYIRFRCVSQPTSWS